MDEPDWEVIDRAIQILNEALKADKVAITKLINYRVKCNDALADHKTIQVREDKNGCTVSMIGIINGLFGVDSNSCGFICYETDDDTNEIIKFKRYKGEY